MVRVGVIGLGAFGEFQIQAMQGIPGIEVVAVASRSSARAEQIARDYHVPAWYSSAAALCADPLVEAVTVATEESRHLEPALAAITTGKPLLVEKPLAATVADAVAIAEAAANNGTLLMPGHIVRFEPRFIALKARIAAGDLGRIAAIHTSRSRPRATLEIYGRCHPALVTAIHDIDAALWMLDERPLSVIGTHQLDTSPDGIYGVWGTFRFASGAILNVEATWMMPNDTGLDCADHFAVTATGGLATIDLASSGLRVLTAGQHNVPEMGYQPWGHDGIAGALQAEFMHFALLVEGRARVPVVSPTDGVAAVIAANALVTAAETGREVTIEWNGLSS